MRKAVREQKVERTPKDKGFRAPIRLAYYDNGLWIINGEVISDKVEVVKALIEIVQRVENTKVKHLKEAA